MTDLSYTESDLVILLLGEIGVGKSTFINKAVGRVVSEVESDLCSCTKDVKGFRIPFPIAGNPSQRVILVDTPGFVDSYDEDVEIFEKIRGWLKQSSSNHLMKFSGIIYFYDIGQARNIAQGDSFITPENFKLPSIIENLHLVATHCNLVDSFTKEEFFRDRRWHVMLDRGARASRFEDSQSSAHKIISEVVQNISLPLSDISDEFDRIHKRVLSSDPKRVKGGFLADLALVSRRNLLLWNTFVSGLDPSSEAPHKSSTTIRTTTKQQSSRKMGPMYQEVEYLTMESTKTTSMMGTAQGEVRKEDKISHATPTTTIDEELAIQKEMESLTVESTKTTATGVVQEVGGRNVPPINDLEELNPQAHDSPRGDLSGVAEVNGVLVAFTEDLTKGDLLEDTVQQSVTLLQTETAKFHEKVHCTSTSSQSTKFDGSSDFGINGGAFFDGMHASSIKVVQNIQVTNNYIVRREAKKGSRGRTKKSSSRVGVPKTSNRSATSTSIIRGGKESDDSSI